MEDQDRFFYLRALAGYLERAEVEFWAFCLRTNRVYLIVVSWREESGWRTGRLSASDGWVREWETRLGQQLLPNPRGCSRKVALEQG